MAHHDDARIRETLPVPPEPAPPLAEDEPATEEQPAPVGALDTAEGSRRTLVVLDGRDAGTVFPVEGDEVRIGRGREVEVALDDPAVSRLHARIFRRGEALLIEDLGSRNGTMVSGVLLEGPRPLGDRCRIRLGSSVLRFAVQDALEAELDRRLYEDGVRDALTGVSNRRHLEERLAGELSYARRCESELSLLLLDIDRFKLVNDRHGHRAGDEVLRSLARLIGSAVRSEDLVARFGGEEFVVLARDMNAEGAEVLAERLRTRIAALQVPWQERSLRVTASVGVASHGAPRGLADASELFAAADAALFQAKGLGRNRVVVRRLEG